MSLECKAGSFLPIVENLPRVGPVGNWRLALDPREDGRRWVGGHPAVCRVFHQGPCCWTVPATEKGDSPGAADRGPLTNRKARRHNPDARYHRGQVAHAYRRRTGRCAVDHDVVGGGLTGNVRTRGTSAAHDANGVVRGFHPR